MYPLEQMLHTLAKQEDSYVMCLLDCATEHVEYIDEEESECNSELSTDREGQENLIITYGSPAERGIRDKPRIAKEYYTYLKQSQSKSNKKLAIPQVLKHFIGPNGTVDQNFKVNKQVRLKWHNLNKN